jgi:hypothetical protein
VAKILRTRWKPGGDGGRVVSGLSDVHSVSSVKLLRTSRGAISGRECGAISPVAR